MARLGDFNRFAKESDGIEGEAQARFHSRIVRYVFENGINNDWELRTLHGRRFHGKPWMGKYRTVNVRVGSYTAPDWSQIPELMAQFWAQWETMDSWEAHNTFERIHPFQDGNGRMGRLIWLAKALKEGYDFEIPFLHKYYYQTLAKYERKTKLSGKKG